MVGYDTIVTIILGYSETSQGMFFFNHTAIFAIQIYLYKAIEGYVKVILKVTLVISDRLEARPRSCTLVLVAVVDPGGIGLRPHK